MYINSLTKYLGLVYYLNLDYNKAKKYFNQVHNVPINSCSSFFKDGLVGRNLDWYYDNSYSFVVRTYNKYSDIHTIGVAGGLNITPEDLPNLPKDIIDIIPFYLQDGINQYSLYCSMNVVPTDYGTTYSDDPDAICTLMIPRYVLDHFTSASEATEALKSMKFYSPKTLNNQGYELHFFIADAAESYVVEVINNEVKVISSNKLTNFFLYGVDYLPSGKVYTPEDVLNHNFPSTHGITFRGSGLERYNLMVDELPKVNSKDTAKLLLNKLRFTNTYKSDTNPIWYSEFVNVRPGITVDTPPTDTDLKEVLLNAQNLFINRERDSKLWQTVHSSVYDLNNLTLNISVQEEDLSYNFNLIDVGMNISFYKPEGSSVYISETIHQTKASNYHIEKNFPGSISIFQRTAGDAFSLVDGFPKLCNVVDYDLGTSESVYPKDIQIHVTPDYPNELDTVSGIYS